MSLCFLTVSATWLLLPWLARLPARPRSLYLHTVGLNKPFVLVTAVRRVPDTASFFAQRRQD